MQNPFSTSNLESHRSSLRRGRRNRRHLGWNDYHGQGWPRTQKQHGHLEEVLKRLKEHGLRANRVKCKFLQTKITYCGHVVDRDRLHKTQGKVDAVVKAPRPENVLFVFRSGELLPQVPAKPGQCPKSAEPTSGTRRAMKAGRMWGGLHQSEKNSSHQRWCLPTVI